MCVYIYICVLYVYIQTYINVCIYKYYIYDIHAERGPPFPKGGHVLHQVTFIRLVQKKPPPPFRKKRLLFFGARLGLGPFSGPLGHTGGAEWWPPALREVYRRGIRGTGGGTRRRPVRAEREFQSLRKGKPFSHPPPREVGDFQCIKKPEIFSA